MVKSTSPFYFSITAEAPGMPGKFHVCLQGCRIRTKSVHTQISGITMPTLLFSGLRSVGSGGLQLYPKSNSAALFFPAATVPFGAAAAASSPLQTPTECREFCNVSF